MANAEKTLLNIDSNKEDYSIEELSTKIKRKKKLVTFNEFTQEIIDGLYDANRIGNAKSYETALNVINTFSKNKNLLFTDIDYKFLKKFEEFHLGKGNSINGFNVYMRAVRAAYNKAIKENIVSSDNYPFKDYQISQQKTIKKAISKEEMKKIVDLELEAGTTLWHARNYFLFSFFTIGMSWVDMASLTRKNILSNRIIYKRAKTGKDYSIEINDNIREILTYYLNQGNKYVFPIIKRDDTELNKRNDMKNRLRRYNANLKKIGLLIGSNNHFTSYVSRHSWASIANFSGIPLGVISGGLGHEDLKTTQTYLANFDKSDIDRANQNIL